MPKRIGYTFVAILCLTGLTTAQRSSWSSHPDNVRKANNDIEFDKEPVEPAAGSGGRMLHTSDDEDLVESGSGSGSGMGDVDIDGPTEKTTFTTPTNTAMAANTTSRPHTNCEKLRQASQQLPGRYIQRCLPNGDFDSLQCHGPPGTSHCWCSDLQGKEIPGTQMEPPSVPNCDNGNNLHPCVHQLVQHVRSKLLGSFRPKCAADGQFDRVQCHGSMCFCVDENTGSRVSGTEVHIPDVPSCDDDSADVNVPEVTTSIPLPESTNKAEDDIDIDSEGDEPEISLPEDGDTIDLDPEVVSNTGKGGESKETEPSHKDNVSDKDDVEVIRKDHPTEKKETDGFHGDLVEKATEIMTQPGILAGIIGGSIVLLLCVVLLVMFIVYRMRKKDEGSYPLDEPRKAPNYNYVRAPEKEFYA